MTKTMKVTIIAAISIAVIGGISGSLYVRAENDKAAAQAAIVLQQEQEAQAKLEAEEMAIAEAKAAADEAERVRIETMNKEAADQLAIALEEKKAADEAARLEDERIAAEEEAARIAQETVKVESVNQPVEQKSVQEAQPPSSGASNPTGNKQITDASQITQDKLPSGIKWGGKDDGSLGHGAGGKDGGY